MDTERHEDFYQALRVRIATWLSTQGEGYKHAQLLLLAPDLFHLLCKIALDARVPRLQKAKLAAAIAYFVSPLDLIPEALVGPIGYVDDLAVAAFALNSVINEGQEAIAREHWAGDGDLLVVIQQVIERANDMLGGGMLKRVLSILD